MSLEYQLQEMASFAKAEREANEALLRHYSSLVEKLKEEVAELKEELDKKDGLLGQIDFSGLPMDCIRGEQE